MMAFLGGICIATGCGGLWLMQMKRQRKLLETLVELSGAMLEIRGQIIANQTPLPRIFLQLSQSAQGHGNDFFGDVICNLQEGKTLQMAWEEAVLSGQFPLEVEGVLLQVGRSFSGDEEQICKVLSLANGCLERIIKQYQEDLPDKRRSTGALCFSGGALLLILLA